jgi:hypothetical protein
MVDQDKLKENCPEYSEEILARGLTQSEIAAMQYMQL